MFNTLDDTPLQKDQITAQGQFVLDQGGNRLEEPSRFAISGGTGPYNSAHGKITEGSGGPLRRMTDSSISSCSH